MPSRCTTRLVWSALAMFAFLTLPFSATAETLRFCYDPYPPFTIVEDDKLTGGIKVDLLNAVIGQIDGLKAEIEILPWKRCQNAVREGQLDGILPLFPNDDRRSYMTFSVDVLSEKSVFWRKRGKYTDNSSWDHDYRRISHLRLGMLEGSYIDKTMEQAFSANAKITRAPSVEALFRMLRHDRIDLLATDLLVGRYVARGLGGADEFEPLVPAIAARSSRFGLSKITGADRHLDAFNRVIEDLHRTGEIERISARE